MKVLVADDEPVSLRLLESSLRRWGYEPVVASDGLKPWLSCNSKIPPNF